jgi:uncharacterized protein (UPF0303 family)
LREGVGDATTGGMTDAPDLPFLEAEAARLILPAWSQADALRLGEWLVAEGTARALPILIDIRTAQMTLFRAVLPGASALNDRWALRKSNTALLFGAPSLLVQHRLNAAGRDLSHHGCTPDLYASSGGAVPLVTTQGLQAVATVSGLPQVEDHRLVVAGIEAVLLG